MSSIINTNSLSLLTQNNLLKSQSSLTTAIQRLSSGLRINSAKDDAAGQAIANRFSSNIKGLSQAQRNANDGISLAQTTEGALNEINNNLQRVRELTVQAANGSNSLTDLDSIQSEISQRMAEIDRTSAQTDFNGTKVLGATAATLNIQVGANDGETIKIDLQAINTTTLGLASATPGGVGFNINGSGSTANAATTKADLAMNTGWNSGGAVGTLGRKTAGAWVAGTADATTGAVTYTQTTNTITRAKADSVTVNYVKATSANVFSAAAAGDTVTLNGSLRQKDKYTLDGGAGAAARYVATANTSDIGSTTNVSDNGPVGGVASYLVPTTIGVISANVTLGGAVQQIRVDSTGNVKDEAGNQLYLDTTGNLTQTQGQGANKLEAANIGKGDAGDLLKSMSVGTVGSIANSATTGSQIKSTGGSITVNQASGSTIKLDIAAFAGVAAVKEAFVATFSGNTDTDTVTFDGVSDVLTANQTGSDNASEYAKAYNLVGAAKFVAVASGANVTFTQKIGSNIADKANSDFVVTNGGGGTDVTVTVAGPVTQGAAATQGTGATWDVQQKLTAADMQSTAAAGTTQVVIAATPNVGTYNISLAGVVQKGVIDAYKTDAATGDPSNPDPGSLTTSTSRSTTAVSQVSADTTEVYSLKTNGKVFDFSGNQVYNDATTVKGFSLTALSSSGTKTANAMDVIDKALAKVDGLRGSLGAVQNRFDSVISNLGSTITNLSASRSRIEDADYATEVSNMTRAQILQQAGTSVLAKANQSTQGVMSLLQ